MAANRDEAIKCISISQRHSEAGNLLLARKFAEKSISLYSTPEAKKLLEIIMEGETNPAQPNGSSSTTAEAHPTQESTHQPSNVTILPALPSSTETLNSSQSLEKSIDSLASEKPKEPPLPRGRFQFEDLANAQTLRVRAAPRQTDANSSGPRSVTVTPKESGQLPVHYVRFHLHLYSISIDSLQQLGDCIGKGQFGTVYRALNLNTGETVAVKRISLVGLEDQEITQLMNEVDLLERLYHPGIVKYEGVARDSDTLSIVLEYVENGSLFHTLKAFGRLNERLVASYVIKILEGLHYLHRSQVVHCDLKAANILTTKNGNVKLSDFGVSFNLRAMETTRNNVAGTPCWSE